MNQHKKIKIILYLYQKNKTKKKKKKNKRYNLVILILPFVLFVLFWFPKFLGVEPEVTLLSRESLTQLVIQIVFLFLICLDFFKVLTIP